MSKLASEASTVIRRLGEGVAYWNEPAEALVVKAFSIEDKKEYKIVIMDSDGYPERPPNVFVVPYPLYVMKKKEYEESHARHCCFKEKSNSGRHVCLFHLNRNTWDAMRREVGSRGSRLLVAVLMNVFQALSLRPPVLNYNLNTHTGGGRYG